MVKSNLVNTLAQEVPVLCEGSPDPKGHLLRGEQGADLTEKAPGTEGGEAGLSDRKSVV